jgi:hypothetical protein
MSRPERLFPSPRLPPPNRRGQRTLYPNSTNAITRPRGLGPAAFEKSVARVEPASEARGSSGELFFWVDTPEMLTAGSFSA